MSRRWLPHLVLSAAAGLLFIGIMGVNHGHFTYALDDPYIHLALSERILGGHYGINPGMAAAPSSSILWPLLLAPWAGTAVHPWLPLIFGLAALLASVELFCRLLPGWAAMLLALLLNLAGLPFTGMEHGLQVALALAALWGLREFEESGRVHPLLVAAILLGPLIRFEALAVSGMTLAVLFLSGRRRLAVGLGLLTLLPLALFAGFLLSLGLPPLPSSILSKLGGAGPAFDPLLLLAVRWDALAEVVLLLLLAASWKVHPRRWRMILFAGGVGLAHLLAGHWGWPGFNRYEVYALALPAVVLLELWSETVRRHLTLAGLALLVLFHPTVESLFRTPWAANDIYLQQWQMHRFVTGWWRAAVAVNDLGWVSYRNPWPVLDLWGLGSEEARLARRENSAGWMGDLTSRHGVALAMIYAEAFPGQIPSSWVPVAKLSLNRPPVSAAGAEVTFYATRPEVVPALRAALAGFAPTLPGEARLKLLAVD